MLQQAENRVMPALTQPKAGTAGKGMRLVWMTKAADDQVGKPGECRGKREWQNSTKTTPSASHWLYASIFCAGTTSNQG